MTNRPNFQKLVIRKMSVQMVPSGGGIGHTISELCRPGGISEHAREATDWAENAILAIKSLPGQPFGSDDESIAAELLRRADRGS